MGLDSLLLCEAVRLRRPSVGSWWRMFHTCPTGVVWGLPTGVSLPHVLESSLARKNDWLIFLYRDALFQFLISSLTIFYGIKCL